MWLFICGLILGFLLEQHRQTYRAIKGNKASAKQKEKAAKSNLELLKSSVSIQSVLEASNLFLQEGLKALGDKQKSTFSVEANLMVGAKKLNGVWVSEFNGHTLFLRDGNDSIKISQKNLGSSSFDFNYSNIEITHKEELVLMATCRNFQNGENEWHSVSELKSEGLKDVIGILNKLSVSPKT